MSPSKIGDILRYLDDCHQGVTNTRQNAASSVRWPGISRDIENYRRDRMEPLKGTDFPLRTWSRVGADFFMHKGHVYLLTIDYYSRYVEIGIVAKNVDTRGTTFKLRKVFNRHGIPAILFTDNGSKFASQEFRDFATLCGFEHVTSSPRYPQSNGEAERGVKTMKALLNKCDDEYFALLAYRNTSLHNVDILQHNLAWDGSSKAECRFTQTNYFRSSHPTTSSERGRNSIATR